MNTTLVLLSYIAVVNLVLCISAQNPLQGKRLYVSPSYCKKVDGTIASLDPNIPDREKILTNLNIARNSPTAIWLNNAQQVQANSTDPQSMNAVLTDAAKTPGTLVVFIINNLPRGQCVQQLDSYKNAFIRNIVTTTNKFKASVSVAFVIEPDAVGTLVTDISSPQCENAQTQLQVWKEAITFTISEFNRNAPGVPLYLGLGHGGWLGIDKNSKVAVEIINSWGIVDKIRGFATNIGNYQAVGKACPKAFFCADIANASNECCINPCNTKVEVHDNNEMNYALRMESFFPGKKFVIDTGRNGVSNARSSCSNWCNIRNTGLGLRPTADTQNPLVDAYLWIKPPGETSGCTQLLPTGDRCKSFNPSCASPDSIGSNPGEPKMPEAGQYSDFMLTMLAKNANFDNVVVPASLSN